MCDKGTNNSHSSTPFAIKSGGSNPFPGSNDIKNGITLDLSWINETTLGHNYVRLGSGSTWYNAYQKLGGHNVSFAGGRDGSTGVGGTVLSGGLSFYSPKRGFIADDVLNFEVVLASGEIVNASESSYTDLFVALKGGGSNFGLVTRFDIATFEDSNQVWGGGLLSGATPQNTLQSLKALLTFTANSYDPNAAVALISNYNTSSGSGELANYLVQTEGVAYPAIFTPQLSIPHFLDMTGYRTMANISQDVSQITPTGLRYV